MRRWQGYRRKITDWNLSFELSCGVRPCDMKNRGLQCTDTINSLYRTNLNAGQLLFKLLVWNLASNKSQIIVQSKLWSFNSSIFLDGLCWFSSLWNGTIAAKTMNLCWDSKWILGLVWESNEFNRWQQWLFSTTINQPYISHLWNWFSQIFL